MLTATPSPLRTIDFHAAAIETSLVTTDVGEHVTRLVGRTGAVQSLNGGFRIRVGQAATFPFALVLTALLRRNFRVDVVERESGMLIEARP